MISYYHDDPEIDDAPKSRRIVGIATLIFALVSGGFFIQTTLAGNININSGSRLEFGQGVTATTACSGSSVLTATPQASFTNASSAGAFYFNSVTVSGIPANCNGSDFQISVYDSTGGALPIFNTSATIATIYDNGGSFSPGVGGIGLSVTSGSGTFTATFTTPVALASTVTKMTLQSTGHSAIPCVQGGDCVIGEVGPGGGRIYYYAAAGFNCGTNYTSTGSPAGGLCHYLEAAPTWGGGAKDAQAIWAISAYQSTDVASITNEASVNNSSSGIGLGYKNTLAIVLQGNNNTTAAGAVRAYTGGSKSDWYLPTSAELNQMCKWARGLPWVSDATVCTSAGTLNTGPGAAGFDESSYDYWSSSEIDASTARVQYFGDGGQGNPSKSLTKNVRPIRAF